ncbi:MAG: glycosyltransferase family 4 protein [Bacteroidia bacterium]|nr:glycosyltransferase family 4 protein [Bacteroidia bacterium]
MKKIRYLLFFGELPPNSIHGIANSNLLNLEMLKSSFVVDIIEEYSKLVDHDKISFIKIVKLIKSNLAIISKSFFQNYDYFYLVFSLSTFGSFKTLIAIINFRLFNRGKVVLHIHRGDFFTRFYKNAINKIMAKLTFRLSHNIIILSDNQKTEFESTFNRPCHVLYNTIEFEYKPEMKNRKNSNFIYISNYLIDKGIMDLLEVFTKLIMQFEKITLKTYGAFSDQHLKEIILKFNSSNICIHETISGISKFTEISQSDCLILPSWNEGQPIILLEAMSVGTPIIATRVGLIPELLGNDYPYFSIPGDKCSLENKIIQFIKQENSAEISRKLTNRYATLYSRKKHTECLLKIFN